MRDTVITCDHCHEKASASSARGGDIRVTAISVDRAVLPQCDFRRDVDLCDDCYGEIKELIIEFVSGPRKRV